MKITDPTLMAGQVAGQAKSEGATDELSRLAGRRDPAGVDKAAREFEAYFVQYMLKEMRKSIQRSELLGGREAMEVFESMLDESISRAVSEGPGLGLAAQIRGWMGVEEEAGELAAAHLPIAPAAAPFAAGYARAAAAYQSQMLEPAGPGGEAKMTSGFGMRVHPILGDERMHTGIDLAMPEGTPIHPAAPGKIVFAGERGGYGNLVIVEHANGYTTRYAHASKILVQPGQQVDLNTVLAESGSTGLSTGPHLHFEVRKDDVPIDPREARWARLP